MSYLSPVRLHFAGRFQANVPTANNDVKRMDPNKHKNPKPSWNPHGDCTWRFLGCRVTAAFVNGQPLPRSSDPVLRYLVQDSDRRSPAKITDIDPQQQLSATIYGLDLRLCTPSGRNVLRGECAATTWNDPFEERAPFEDFDGKASAGFQTVITLLEPPTNHASDFLRQLLAASPSGRMSLKFTVDGYEARREMAKFTTGRIVGTIGPVLDNEPDHFVLGRHLVGDLSSSFNHAVARVDQKAILLDVGNTLQTDTLGGRFIDCGDLTLRCRATKKDRTHWNFGSIPYRMRGWYTKFAGVVELPLDEEFGPEQLADLGRHPLELWSGENGAVLSESEDGFYARADDVVYRLEPGKPQDVVLYVTRFGFLTRGPVELEFDAAMLEERGGPNAGRPEQLLTWSRVSFDQDGKGRCTLQAEDPGGIRGFFFDGQIFCVRLKLVGVPEIRNAHYDVVSVRVWSLLNSTKSAWETVKDILTYYKRLFPTKDRFIDLTDPRDLAEYREMLLLALTLPIDDPNHMPATRDLSPYRRDAIVHWLESMSEEPGPRKIRRSRASRETPTKPLPPPLTDKAMRPGKVDALRAARLRLQNASSQ